jgi:hypothetical protein
MDWTLAHILTTDEFWAGVVGTGVLGVIGNYLNVPDLSDHLATLDE